MAEGRPSGVSELPRRREDLSVREVEGELVILDRRSEKVHQLNQTASAIWHRCDGEHNAGEIAEELGQLFDVDLEVASHDVEVALSQLAALELLETNR